MPRPLLFKDNVLVSGLSETATIFNTFVYDAVLDYVLMIMFLLGFGNDCGGQ